VGGDRESLVEVRDPSGGFVMRGSDARDEGDDPTVAADGARLADLDGKIVECAWDKDAAGLGAGAGFRDGEDPGSNPTRGGTVGAWRYMLVRSDKDTPNFVTVYKHTLRSILDDITSEELVRFVRGVLEKQAREAAENGTGYAPPS
jgi:mRNA-capping enzyme